MIINGIVSNYKYYEDSQGSQHEHFYEITCTEENEEVSYYAHGKDGAPVPFGTSIQLDTSSKIVKIEKYEFLIEGPFKKRLNIVNYKGFVLDCLDSDAGIYNLDNEIYLFGSACLDLPIGCSITLFNLHLIPMQSFSWMFKLFGKSIKKSSHVLVYCPAFSSYLESFDSVSYDNIIETQSNFVSLIYANKWLKSNFNFEFPGFQILNDFSSSFFNIESGAQFIGHCQKCTFSDIFFEYDDSQLSKQKLLSAKYVKESFHETKTSLQEKSMYNNQVLSSAISLKNFIVKGVIRRKRMDLFDLTSDDKTIPIYCEDSNFNPADDSIVFIFNAYKIVELVPKLRLPNSWTAKAYLWISPETKVLSSEGVIKKSLKDFIHPNGLHLCKIVRKYLVLKDFEGVQYETTVIHVQSKRGIHCFYLNPSEKYYGIVISTEEETENIVSIRHLIQDSYINQVSEEEIILPSSALIPTLSFDLKINDQNSGAGPLQVNLNHIPYLPMIKGLQFFSIKLRTFSISSLSLKLICSKCKSQVESSKCLGHLDDFKPAIGLSCVIKTADLNDSHCSILIDQFNLFEKLYKLDNSFKLKLIEQLKAVGSIKLESEHFSFKDYFNSSNDNKPTLQVSVAKLIPRVSKLINCTFSYNVNCILKPINLEICDSKLEIMDNLKLF